MAGLPWRLGIPLNAGVLRLFARVRARSLEESRCMNKGDQLNPTQLVLHMGFSGPVRFGPAPPPSILSCPTEENIPTQEYGP